MVHRSVTSGVGHAVVGRAIAAGVTVGFLVAGCGVIPDDREIDAPVPPPAQIHPRFAGCRAVGAFGTSPTGSQPPSSGRVPNGFRATEVVWCAESDWIGGSAPGNGLERRSTQTAPLIGYLALRSRVAAPGDNLVCSLDAELFPRLFLVDDARRWIVPRLPTDACGKTLPTPGGGPAPWTTLSYTDRVVCTYREIGDASVCR